MIFNSSSDIPAESSIGPAAPNRFDFTLVFESIVLSIVPSTLFFIIAPQRLFWLIKQPRKVTRSSRSVLKVALIGVYTTLQLVDLLYLAIGPSFVTKSQLAAAVLVFVNGLLLLLVSHAEHTRSVSPSTIINVYLLSTLLFDCVNIRTLWLLGNVEVLARLSTSAAAIKAVVLAAEAWEKRSILLSQYRELSPEVTSGILNRTVFWWLNPLMKAGFGRSLTDQDLFPIHESLEATRLLGKSQHAWESANKSDKNALFRSTLIACKWVFLSGVFPRLCLIALKYTQPFLISRTTEFAGDLSQPDEIGWGLTGAWLLVFLGLAVGNGFYYHMTYRFVTAVRGSLGGMIYCKTLTLSANALDESIAVTLMSTDSENICLTFANLHEVWASPIECCVALYLLYRNLGLAALTPMTVTMIATISIMQLARFMGNAQRTWIRGTQTRVDVTASMLGSMKEVKMLGLTDLLTQTVQKLRVKELNLASKYRRLLSCRVFLGSSTVTIAPLATFATFVIISQGTGQPLNVASAYSSLSLIYLLSDPISIVIRTIPMLSAAKACFERIQNFILSESCEDMRQSLSPSPSEDSWPLQENTSPGNTISLELRNLRTQPAVHYGSPLMVVANASFGWSTSEPAILKDISCTIRAQQLTFIIGNVGSGKSTLMKALLGEIRPAKGSIYTASRDIALASQEPWIQNLTLRENILGAAAFDKAWYDRVISACSLERDVLELPNQDATKTGSAGVSLSGGQKQRLTLARALYSKRKIVFLDDVFAGQDARTEEHIYQSLFAKDGLFREMGTTVVCITNTIHRLAYADHVIALDESGHIFHQGSFEKLQSSTNYLHGLQIEQNGSDQSGDKAAPQEPNLSTAPRRQTTQEQPPSTTGFAGELATYGYYLGASPLWYTCLFAVLIVFYSAGFKSTELLLSFWTGQSSDAQEVNRFYLGFYGMLAGISIIGITGSAFFYLTIMVPRNSEVLHARLLNTVMGAPLSFFSNTDVGVTTNRFSQDMSVIDTELPYTLIDFALNITTVVMAAVLMCVFSGYFAATLPPIILFCWVLQKFYLKTSRQIRLLDLEAKSPLFTQFLDLLQGLSSVRAFAWEARFQERYLELLDASQRPYYLLFCVQRWLELVLDLMVAVLATILMVLVVRLRADFSPRFVALAVLNVTAFSQTLTNVIKEWTQLETSFGAVARVKKFCEDTESENDAAKESATNVPESWPLYGRISIKNLTAAYTADGEPVLRNISLEIPAGSTVGICGRSGSGKSSLVACLLRMMEVSSDSRIEIDGIDITSLPRQTVRTAVAVVPQHPFFLKNIDVRHNLIPLGASGGQQPDDNRILAVLQRLEMREAVERMGGLDSMLDMDRLSQGQRQLLCLARAVLAGKRIILLDEASSNVDERSERLIRQVIREQFVGCTVIAIAHRIGGVADFDRVAVMGGGKILEWDDPRALLSRDSEFKKLWDLGSG